MPKQMANGVWRVQEGEGFVRLLVPNRYRLCAPCCMETNTGCCGGRKTVHLYPEGDLTLPAIQWLRVRISYKEWDAFIYALDASVS